MEHSSATEILDRGDQFRDYRPPIDVPQSTLPAVDILNNKCFDKFEVYYPLDSRRSKFFIPWDRLLEVISVPSVQTALQRWNEDISLTSNICFSTDDKLTTKASYRRMLGILVHLGRAEDILVFIKNGLNDSKLPLRLKPDRTGLMYTKAGTDVDVDFLQDWDKRTVKEFGEVQFAFISPYFVRPADGRLLHYILSEEDVLPILEESKWIREPGDENPQPDTPVTHGVKQIQLHECHYDFGDYGFVTSTGPNHLFAMKSLSSNDREVFKREVDFLKRTNHIRNAHLNKLLVTFEANHNGGLFHLVFPWAESDLYSFWKHRRPDTCHTAWIAQQLSGLASALALIHDDSESQPAIRGNEPTYGRHGDLKPENILWFPGQPDCARTGGILVLNDFGLGRYHRQQSRSVVRPWDIMTSRTYRPPECDVKGGRINRKFDIWCLGATFLEFVIWYLRGFEDVEFTFPEAREEEDNPNVMMGYFFSDTFFRVNHDHSEAFVKPSVADWIQRLKADDRSAGFLRDLLLVIETRMLVVDQHARFTARQLADHLRELCSKHSV